jgi:hypothetical protein
VRKTLLFGLFALTVAACGDHLPRSDALAGPTAAGSSSVQPTASATATPVLDASPIAVGPDPRVGTLAGGLLAGWVYTGRSGTLAPEPSRSDPTSGGRSPGGRFTLEQRNVMGAGYIDRADLWLIDTRAGSERLLYSPPPVPQSSAKPVQPNPNLPPYVFQRTEYPGSWSPDERYLTMWKISIVSGSADADGRELVVIDVATGTLIELGWSLYTPQVWRAPHTLAYVAGAGREAWKNKTLRVWTPEAGARDITGAGEVGLAPSWGPDGRLWYVRAPSGDYDVPTYFAGRGIGDRSIEAIDLATGTRTRFPRAAGYADEGARVSDDGRVALVLRRKLDPTGHGTPVSWIELWAARPDGSEARALVRVSATGGFGYYGMYGSLTRLRWEK